MNKYLNLLILILAALLLTAAAGMPALPILLYESFEPDPGSDLTWYQPDPTLSLGNQDASPPAGAPATWGQQCLGFYSDAYGLIVFEDVQRVNLALDVFITSQPNLSVCNWQVHLGSVLGTPPGFFLTGSSLGDWHTLTLTDGQTLIQEVIVSAGAYHIGFSSDLTSGHFVWTVADEQIVDGYSTWSPESVFNGLSYATWNCADKVFFDNITVSPFPPRHYLYLPQVQNSVQSNATPLPPP